MTGEHMISFEMVGEAIIIRVLNSEFGAYAGEAINVKLDEFEHPDTANLVLDLSRVTFMDSLGLSVLLNLATRMKACGYRLALAGLNAHCMGVMNVCGLARKFAIFPTASAALKGLRQKIIA